MITVLTFQHIHHHQHHPSSPPLTTSPNSLLPLTAKCECEPQAPIMHPVARKIESKALRGVYFEGNVYAGSGDSVRLDPAFTDGTDTIVANEINGGCILRLTARRALVATLVDFYPMS